jgi:tail tube protein gp19
MRTRTLVLVAVAVFAVVVGGFVYVAVKGGDDARRVGAFSQTQTSLGPWQLQLNGANAGPLKSVSGCEVSAAVVSVAGGGKRAGQVKYGSCRVQFGLSMTPAFYKWIGDALGKSPAPAAMNLLQADANGKVATNVELVDARLSGFSTPALDGGSQDLVLFTADLVAGAIRKGPLGGSLSGGLSQKASSATAANFRVTIPGVDAKRVAKVGSWSFEVPYESSSVGADKIVTAAAGPPKLGDLQLEVSEGFVADFDAMLQDLISGQGQKTTAKVELLNTAMTATVFMLSLDGVGMDGGVHYATDNRRAYSFYADGATIAF